MKTFGLFIILFLFITIGLTLILEHWSYPEIIIQSTLLAYIMQKYFEKEIDK